MRIAMNTIALLDKSNPRSKTSPERYSNSRRKLSIDTAKLNKKTCYRKKTQMNVGDSKSIFGFCALRLAKEKKLPCITALSNSNVLILILEPITKLNKEILIRSRSKLRQTTRSSNSRVSKNLNLTSKGKHKSFKQLEDKQRCK